MCQLYAGCWGSSSAQNMTLPQAATASSWGLPLHMFCGNWFSLERDISPIATETGLNLMSISGDNP